MDMIQQQYDEKDGKVWDDAVENQRAQFAAESFLSDVGRRFYGSDHNAKLLVDRLNQLDKPLTRRNFYIAFEELTDLGLLDKRPAPRAAVQAPVDTSRGVQRMENTVVVRHSVEDTAENRRALLAEISNRRAMGGEVGTDPRKTELGRQHQLIKAQHYQQSDNTNATRLEAVAAVNLAHPELKRHSPTFNRLVAEEIARQR